MELTIEIPDALFTRPQLVANLTLEEPLPDNLLVSNETIKAVEASLVADGFRVEVVGKEWDPA